MASMVYAGKIIKDLGLEGDYTLWVTGTVQEEDCDGLCWDVIMKEKVLDPAPEIVVITEPTNLNIYRGHRGRMEICVRTHGVSCHGSAPERGKNAVYMMAKIANEIEKLNDRLHVDPFLGKGTVTISYIDCKTPSLCAVPDEAYIHLDRRLTAGETEEIAVNEVKDAVKRAGFEVGKDADVEVLTYTTPSYTGYVPNFKNTIRHGFWKKITRGVSPRLKRTKTLSARRRKWTSGRFRQRHRHHGTAQDSDNRLWSGKRNLCPYG